MNEELEVCEIINGPRYIQSLHDLMRKGIMNTYNNGIQMRLEFRFRNDLLACVTYEEISKYDDWVRDGRTDHNYEVVEKEES